MAALDAAGKERCADGSDPGEGTGAREPQAIGRFGSPQVRRLRRPAGVPIGSERHCRRAARHQRGDDGQHPASQRPVGRPRAKHRRPASAPDCRPWTGRQQDASAARPGRRSGASDTAAEQLAAGVATTGCIPPANGRWAGHGRSTGGRHRRPIGSERHRRRPARCRHGADGQYSAGQRLLGWSRAKQPASKTPSPSGRSAAPERAAAPQSGAVATAAAS